MTFTLPIDAVAFRTITHLVVSPSELAQREAGYLELLSALLRSRAYLQTHREAALAIVKKCHPALADDVLTDALDTATLDADRDGILAFTTLARQDGTMPAGSKPLAQVALEPYHKVLLTLDAPFPG